MPCQLVCKLQWVALADEHGRRGRRRRNCKPHMPAHAPLTQPRSADLRAALKQVVIFNTAEAPLPRRRSRCGVTVVIVGVNDVIAVVVVTLEALVAEAAPAAGDAAARQRKECRAEPGCAAAGPPCTLSTPAASGLFAHASRVLPITPKYAHCATTASAGSPGQAPQENTAESTCRIIHSTASTGGKSSEQRVGGPEVPPNEGDPVVVGGEKVEGGEVDGRERPEKPLRPPPPPPRLRAVSACALCLTALPPSPPAPGGGVFGGGNGGSSAAAPTAEARAVSRATATSDARPRALRCCRRLQERCVCCVLRMLRGHVRRPSLEVGGYGVGARGVRCVVQRGAER